MKKILISLIALYVFQPLCFAASFSDVSESHPYYAAIESLKNLKIINGYGNGTFKPSESVVRAAALKMILESADIQCPDKVEDSGFPDVKVESWYAKYAAKAKELEIVKGDGETGKFEADRNVKKAEFIKMILVAFKQDISKHQNLNKDIAKDVLVKDWFLPFMSYAKIIGIISPTIDNRLEPNKNLTRGECAEIIYKMLVLQRGGETQKMLNIIESDLVTILIELNNNNIAVAIKKADEAVLYSQKALALSPDKSIVKAANKITLGFKNLCLAYQAGLDQKNEDVLKYANEAKKLAGDAYTDDQSTQALGKKIKEQADVLIKQASK